MNYLTCFVSVEFVDDPNVVGYTYWYICNIEGVKVGDKVIAPLGHHNKLQEGLVREVRICDDSQAPFPIHLIKNIRKIL